MKMTSQWVVVLVVFVAAMNCLVCSGQQNVGVELFDMDKEKYELAATQQQVEKFKAEIGDLYALPEMIVAGRRLSVRLGNDAAEKALPSRPGVPRPAPLKMPEGVNHLDRRSFQATLRTCNQKQPGSDGEKIVCVSSREAMVSFVESMAGKGATALATTPAPAAKLNYIIKGRELLMDYGAAPVVVCHNKPFPFPVMACHKVSRSAVYRVSLIDESGDHPVRSIAVCHKNTFGWSPKHVSFQLLPGNVTPGKVTPVCHFLYDSDIAWTRLAPAV